MWKKKKNNERYPPGSSRCFCDFLVIATVVLHVVGRIVDMAFDFHVLPVDRDVIKLVTFAILDLAVLLEIFRIALNHTDVFNVVMKNETELVEVLVVGRMSISCHIHLIDEMCNIIVLKHGYTPNIF